MRIAGDIRQQVPEDAVDEVEGDEAGVGNLAEGKLHFIGSVIEAFVHAGGLAGGADECAAEQIGQSGVMLPVGDEASQQIGSAQ